MKRSCQDVTNVTKRHLRSVGVQVISELESCQGAEFKLGVTARVRVYDEEQIYLASRQSRSKKIKKKRRVRADTQPLVFARLAFTSPGKNCDKLINYTVRVSRRHLFILSDMRISPLFIPD
jgi:hypothetical protein